MFDGLKLSFSLFTVLPFFNVHTFKKGINGYAVMFLPLIGFVLGYMLFLFSQLITPVFPEAVNALLVLTLMVVLNGALHLDGFADSCDGFFVPKEKALCVMEDPHIGAMGAIFTLLLLMLKAAILLEFDAWYLLPIILMLSRFNALCAIYIFPYLKAQGMGTLFKAEFDKKQYYTAIVMCVACAFLYAAMPLVIVAFALFLMISYALVKRYGGYSGDMYGFMIEVSEVGLLLYCVGL